MKIHHLSVWQSVVITKRATYRSTIIRWRRLYKEARDARDQSQTNISSHLDNQANKNPSYQIISYHSRELFSYFLPFKQQQHRCMRKTCFLTLLLTEILPNIVDERLGDIVTTMKHFIVDSVRPVRSDQHVHPLLQLSPTLERIVIGDHATGHTSVHPLTECLV